LVTPEQTQQTAFRLPLQLLDRIDRHGARLREEQPGITITRADVVRLLLTRALDDVESQTGPGRSGLRKKR
jgi:hypothetical protein